MRGHLLSSTNDVNMWRPSTRVERNSNEFNDTTVISIKYLDQVVKCLDDSCHRSNPDKDYEKV